MNLLDLTLLCREFGHTIGDYIFSFYLTLRDVRVRDLEGDICEIVCVWQINIVWTGRSTKIWFVDGSDNIYISYVFVDMMKFPYICEGGTLISSVPFKFQSHPWFWRCFPSQGNWSISGNEPITEASMFQQISSCFIFLQIHVFST